MKILQEGPLATILNKFINLLLLNILWFLCSLPVITLGASTCAVYEVTMQFALHEDPPVFKTFFQAFGRNFKKASALFLIFLAAGLFLLVDLWCALQWQTPFRIFMIILILSVCYFYLAVLSHVFPVLSYFNTGIVESIKKAFLLSMSNGIFTIFIMVMNMLPVFAIIKFPDHFGEIIFFYFIIEFCVIAYLNSLHLIRLFDSKQAEHIRRR